jgi:hypothetical protein
VPASLDWETFIAQTPLSGHVLFTHSVGEDAFIALFSFESRIVTPLVPRTTAGNIGSNPVMPDWRADNAAFVYTAQNADGLASAFYYSFGATTAPALISVRSLEYSLWDQTGARLVSVCGGRDICIWLPGNSDLVSIVRPDTPVEVGLSSEGTTSPVLLQPTYEGTTRFGWAGERDLLVALNASGPDDSVYALVYQIDSVSSMDTYAEIGRKLLIAIAEAALVDFDVISADAGGAGEFALLVRRQDGNSNMWSEMSIYSFEEGLSNLALERHTVFPAEYDVSAMGWSPDGKAVVLAGTALIGGQPVDGMFVMSRDGTQITRIPESQAGDNDPDWTANDNLP